MMTLRLVTERTWVVAQVGFLHPMLLEFHQAYALWSRLL